MSGSHSEIIDQFMLFEKFSSLMYETINVMKIGIIQSVDTELQEVEVTIAEKKIVENNGKNELANPIFLVKVPYLCLGGGSSYLSFPIQEGDECIVLFNDFAMQNWRNTGTIMPPNENRLHDLCDCIAIVGLRNVNRLIQNYSSFVKLFMNDRSFMEIQDSGILLKTVSNVDVVTTGTSSETADGTSFNVVADNTSISKDVYIGNDVDIGNDTLIEGNLTVNKTTTIDQTLLVKDNATFQKNVITTLNTESATYSTGNTPGITGVFVNAAGQKLIFTNGLITAVE